MNVTHRARKVRVGPAVQDLYCDTVHLLNLVSRSSVGPRHGRDWLELAHWACRVALKHSLAEENHVKSRDAYPAQSDRIGQVIFQQRGGQLVLLYSPTLLS